MITRFGLVAGVSVAIAFAVACSSEPAPAPVAPAPAAEARQYLLERVDDAAVVQLYADGFTALPLREKTLVWHLYEATIAGRDIFYDQKSARGLEMREVLEAILTHPEGVDPTALNEIQRYTKLFWINSGPYNNLTARKFVLGSHPMRFARPLRPPPRPVRSSPPRPARASTRS
jgi:hypothetical protein